MIFFQVLLTIKNQCFPREKFILLTRLTVSSIFTGMNITNIFTEMTKTNKHTTISSSDKKSQKPDGKLRNLLGMTGVLSVLLSGLNMQKMLAAAPVVWVTSGMERVRRQDPPKTTTNIDLYAARGEYEPFQIVIQAPPGNLTNVNVTVSDLYGPNGQVISKKNLTLYREHFVGVNQGSPIWGGMTNKSTGTGMYADALIPFIDPATQQPPTQGTLKAVPFNLSAAYNQPIWVDVLVPRNAQAGLYTGKYVVTSNQGRFEGKISLNVWNFTLPVKPSLKSSFGLSAARPKRDFEELIRHKLMPREIRADYERQLIDNLGLNSTNINFWSGADLTNCRMNPPPSVNDIKTAIAAHQRDMYLYNRTADEIGRCTNLFEPLKQWARNLHQAGLDNLVTIAPIPELYSDGSGTGRSAVDTWVILPKQYENAPDRVATVLRKGDKVWSYNALVQSDHAPAWLIDYAPMNYRIQPGFINQSLGLTGLLYWRVDLWSQDPWNNVEVYKVGDRVYPGEGMLFYPGQQVGMAGVVPSMRLKWLREGVEDYEYVEMLKRLGRKDWALQISRQAGPDWKNWTKSISVLESTRRQLGNELSRLAPQ